MIPIYLYIVQNPSNVEVQEIDPYRTHEKTVNFVFIMHSCCYGALVSIRKKSGLHTANI